MSDERKLRSARARETVSLPFLLLPRTPSSSLLSLPCADAQGWKATSLDNARKFRMKFTVADHFHPFTILSITHNPAITIKPSTCIRLRVLLKNPAFSQNGPIALERIVSITPARERTCVDIEHFTVRHGGRKCIPGGQIQLAFSYAHFIHFSIR